MKLVRNILGRVSGTVTGLVIPLWLKIAGLVLIGAIVLGLVF